MASKGHDETWDFIIVGGGSAGCVLANRLSANPDTRVLLLEAGGSDRSLFIAVPVLVLQAITKYNWKYLAEPDEEAYVRRTAWRGDHPTCTCRMGADDLSVVDPGLRVRGVTGLRVADASIMPTLVSGNTNVPSTMIGQKASAMILEEHA